MEKNWELVYTGDFSNAERDDASIIPDIISLKKLPFTIGREVENSEGSAQIFLSVQRRNIVSKHHAQISLSIKEPGRLVIKEIDAPLNGTFINNIRLSSDIVYELLEGSVLNFGIPKGSEINRGQSAEFIRRRPAQYTVRCSPPASTGNPQSKMISRTPESLMSTMPLIENIAEMNSKSENKKVDSLDAEMEEELQCQICFGYLAFTAMLQCGHSFCWSCIYDWSKKTVGNPPCPNDNHPFELEKILRNFTIDNYIELRMKKLPADSVEVKIWRERQKKGMNIKHWQSDTSNARAAFLDAAKMGRLEEMKEILAFQASLINIKDQHKCTALHYAVQGGHVDLCKFLIQMGSNIHQKNKNNESALHLAAKAGQKEACALLLENGATADSNKSDEDPDNEDGKNNRKNGCDDSDSNVIIIDEDNVRGSGGGVDSNVIIIEEDGDDDNDDTGGDSHNKVKNVSKTPLYLAASGGHEELCTILIGAGANIICAFQLAATNKQLQACRLLIEKSGNANLQNSEGNSFLHCLSIAHYDSEELIDLLVQRGANLNLQNNARKTALHIALHSNHICAELVEMLVNKGVSLKVQDENGNTCLHYLALYSNDEQLYQLLIERGAELNVQNRHNKTVLHLAVVHNRLKLVQLLLDKGAALHLVDGEGRTAVGYAIKFGQTQFAKLLIEHGASFDLEKSRRIAERRKYRSLSAFLSSDAALKYSKRSSEQTKEMEAGTTVGRQKKQRAK